MSTSARVLRVTMVLACSLASVLARVDRVQAYSLKPTSSGAHVRWHRSSITLELAYVGEDTCDRTRVLRALEGAAQTWSRVPGVPAIIVRDAAGERTWGPGGVNGVYVLERWPFPQRDLAVTVSSIREDTGELLDTDILVNGEMSLELLDEEHGGDHFDLGEILTHELGHVLGLDESGERDATMWPHTRRGETARRELAPDDVDGVLALYGGAPVATHVRYGCAITASRGDGVGIALFVMLALVLASRRRLPRCYPGSTICRHDGSKALGGARGERRERGCCERRA